MKGPTGPAIEGVNLKALNSVYRWFESRWMHGFSSLSFDGCFVGSEVCDELITQPEESFLCVCVSKSVWSVNLKNDAIWAQNGLLRHEKKKTVYHNSNVSSYYDKT